MEAVYTIGRSLPASLIARELPQWASPSQLVRLRCKVNGIDAMQNNGSETQGPFYLPTIHRNGYTPPFLATQTSSWTT